MISTAEKEAEATAVATAPLVGIIIVYKYVRGGLALIASLLLTLSVATGHTSALSRFVHLIRSHATSGWIHLMVEKLLSGSPVRLWLSVAAIAAFDAGITILEAWALQRHLWWAPWLIVVVTSAFVPVEIIALLRHVSVGRVLVLIANVAVAVYLLLRARAGHEELKNRQKKS